VQLVCVDDIFLIYLNPPHDFELLLFFHICIFFSQQSLRFSRRICLLLYPVRSFHLIENQLQATASIPISPYSQSPTNNKMGFEFIFPILTPAAKAAVIADPTLLPALIFVLISISMLCSVVWFISFMTWKAYPRPKKAPFWSKFIKGKKTEPKK
jgi:hypothetical protein